MSSTSTNNVEEIIKNNTKEFDKMIFNLIDYPHKYNYNYNNELEQLTNELKKNNQALEDYKNKASTEYNLYHKLQLQQHYFDYISSYYSGYKKSADESVNKFFELLSINSTAKSTTK